MCVFLRPATGNDWSTIRKWLAKPEIQRWWAPCAPSEAEVITALGSQHALARMIQVDGRYVGYGHAVDAALWGDNLPENLAPGTWDLDIFVAEPDCRGRGIGAKALSLLRDEVFETTLAVAVCILPSIENEQAVRAYEKIGFKWQNIWRDPVSGPSWFMVSERP